MADKSSDRNKKPNDSKELKPLLRPPIPRISDIYHDRMLQRYEDDGQNRIQPRNRENRAKSNRTKPASGIKRDSVNVPELWQVSVNKDEYESIVGENNALVEVEAEDTLSESTNVADTPADEELQDDESDQIETESIGEITSDVTRKPGSSSSDSVYYDAKQKSPSSA